jgi:hypothetical protein
MHIIRDNKHRSILELPLVSFPFLKLRTEGEQNECLVGVLLYVYADICIEIMEI